MSFNTDGEDATVADPESKMLGEIYPYWSVIRDPDELMSTKGDFANISRNAQGLLSYADILLNGSGRANVKCGVDTDSSTCSELLGDRYALKTLGKCKRAVVEIENDNVKTNANGEILLNYIDSNGAISDAKNVNMVNRNSLINNIPTGNLPFMEESHNRRGVIPSVLETAMDLNPIGILNAMTEFSIPTCIKIKYKQVLFNKDNENKHKTEDKYAYIAVSELKSIKNSVFNSMDIHLECNDNTFKKFGGVNPFYVDPNLAPVQQNFTTIFNSKKDNRVKYYSNNKKPLAKLYTLSIGLLFSYLLYKTLNREIKL